MRLCGFVAKLERIGVAGERRVLGQALHHRRRRQHGEGAVGVVRRIDDAVASLPVADAHQAGHDAAHVGEDALVPALLEPRQQGEHHPALLPQAQAGAFRPAAHVVG